MSEITEGSRITTRYFGGYEAVIVRQIHATYFVVARGGGTWKNLHGGEATDILPRDQVEKVTSADGPPRRFREWQPKPQNQLRQPRSTRK